MRIQKKKEKQKCFFPLWNWENFPPNFSFFQLPSSFLYKRDYGISASLHAWRLSCLLANWSAYVYMCVFVCVLVTHSYLSLCDPTDCSPPDSSVHRILQARILEWVAIIFYRGSSPPRKLNPGLLHCRQILYIWTTREALNITGIPNNFQSDFTHISLISFLLNHSVISNSLQPHGL